jgi:hypothetical protein
MGCSSGLGVGAAVVVLAQPSDRCLMPLRGNWRPTASRMRPASSLGARRTFLVGCVSVDPVIVTPCRAGVRSRRRHLGAIRSARNCAQRSSTVVNRPRSLEQTLTPFRARGRGAPVLLTAATATRAMITPSPNHGMAAASWPASSAIGTARTANAATKSAVVNAPASTPLQRTGRGSREIVVGGADVEGQARGQHRAPARALRVQHPGDQRNGQRHQRRTSPAMRLITAACRPG